MKKSGTPRSSASIYRGISMRGLPVPLFSTGRSSRLSAPHCGPKSPPRSNARMHRTTGTAERTATSGGACRPGSSTGPAGGDGARHQEASQQQLDDIRRAAAAEAEENLRPRGNAGMRICPARSSKPGRIGAGNRTALESFGASTTALYRSVAEREKVAILEAALARRRRRKMRLITTRLPSNP